MRPPSIFLLAIRNQPEDLRLFHTIPMSTWLVSKYSQPHRTAKIFLVQNVWRKTEVYCSFFEDRSPFNDKPTKTRQAWSIWILEFFGISNDQFSWWPAPFFESTLYGCWNLCRIDWESDFLDDIDRVDEQTGGPRRQDRCSMLKQSIILPCQNHGLCSTCWTPRSEPGTRDFSLFFSIRGVSLLFPWWSFDDVLILDEKLSCSLSLHWHLMLTIGVRRNKYKGIVAAAAIFSLFLLVANDGWLFFFCWFGVSCCYWWCWSGLRVHTVFQMQ